MWTRKSTRIITVRQLPLCFDSPFVRSCTDTANIKPPDHFCCSRHCPPCLFTIGERGASGELPTDRHVARNFLRNFSNNAPLQRVSPFSAFSSHQTTPLKRNKYLTRHLRLCTRVTPSCDPFIEIVRLPTLSFPHLIYRKKYLK